MERSTSLEDYLEAIHKSLEGKGKARTKDVADQLNVKAPSVTEMFQKLESKGLVNYQKYGGVTLTDRGEKLALAVRDTHRAIRKFFRIIQVSREQADEDACKVEHNLSAETTRQLKKFVGFIEACPREEPEWIEHFQRYSDLGEFPNECGD